MQAEPDKNFEDVSSGKRALIRRSDFELALAQANDLVALKGLYDQVATMEDLAKRLKLALDEENRIAEARIEVARKLGELLHKTVRRGGLGSNFQRGSSMRRGGSSAPLPAGISWAMSCRLQKLAAIPQDQVARYFATQRERAAVISMSGLLHAAEREKERTRRVARRGNRLGPTVPGWAGVLDAIARVVDVNLCVGLTPPRSWQDARELAADGREMELRGSVLVVVPEGEEKEWFTRLHAERVSGRVSEALAIVPAETGERWFKCLEEGWTCCFLRAGLTIPEPHVVAYHGEKRRAFALVFGELGVVLDGIER